MLDKLFLRDLWIPDVGINIVDLNRVLLRWQVLCLSMERISVIRGSL